MTQLEAVRDALQGADRRLNGPDSPFEVIDEVVCGERMAVFRHRPRSLRDVLAAAVRFGDQDCFVFSDGSRITFADVPARVASVAAYLRDVHGVRKGDRVAICAENGPGWLLVQWATFSLGGVVVAMNGWWSELEAENALELALSTVVFADAKRGARLRRPYVDLNEAIGRMVAFAPDARLPDEPIAEDDPAALLFTSGTTGRPRQPPSRIAPSWRSPCSSSTSARGARLSLGSSQVRSPPPASVSSPSSTSPDWPRSSAASPSGPRRCGHSVASTPAR